MLKSPSEFISKIVLFSSLFVKEGKGIRLINKSGWAYAQRSKPSLNQAQVPRPNPAVHSIWADLSPIQAHSNFQSSVWFSPIMSFASTHPTNNPKVRIINGPYKG